MRLPQPDTTITDSTISAALQQRGWVKSCADPNTLPGLWLLPDGGVRRTSISIDIIGGRWDVTLTTPDGPGEIDAGGRFDTVLGVANLLVALDVLPCDLSSAYRAGFDAGVMAVSPALVVAA